MTTNTPKVLCAALLYAKLGWRVIPLHAIAARQCTCSRKGKCEHPAKHPRSRNGLKDATTDRQTINRWWRQWPNANVGVVCGAESGIVVIDIDPRHGGDETWRALIAENGEPPRTVKVLTGGGGEHYVFAHPGERVKSRNDVRPGVDVKGDGGYVVAAPSVHESGMLYRYADGLRPTDIAPAPLPEWLLALVTSEVERPRAESHSNGDGLGSLLAAAGAYVAKADAPAEGGRNGGAFSLAGHLAAFETSTGQRLDEGSIVALMTPWNLRLRPPLTDRELQTTIRSALTNGSPRSPHVVEGRGSGPGVRPAAASSETKTEAPAAPVARFEPFPVDAMPEPVAGYVRAGAKSIGCDPSMIALPLMAGLASAIGATRRIRLKSDWAEPAVLWACVIADSGAQKSPAQAIALGPLRRLQAYRLEELPELIEAYERDLLLYDTDLHNWKSKGRKNNEPPPEKPEEPSVSRYIANDITTEALAEQLKRNPRGLLCDCDELGTWLGGFDQYRGGKGADVARWLSMHRAESLLVDRKTGLHKTTFVKYAAVSIAGGIQPGTLRRALGSRHFENGLAARLLLVAPPRKKKRWTDATVHPDAIREVQRAFARLLALEFAPDENESPGPVDLTLTRDAKKVWTGFYDEHAEALANASGNYASALAKLEGAAPRLALLDHLVRWAADDESLQGRTEVGPDSIAAGVRLARWFATEARRIYAMLHETEQERDRRQLVELVARKGGVVVPRDLMRSSRRFPTAEAGEAALEELVRAGIGRWELDDHAGGRGRPVRRFVLLEGVDVDTNTSTPEEKVIVSTSTVSTAPENEWGEI